MMMMVVGMAIHAALNSAKLTSAHCLHPEPPEPSSVNWGEPSPRGSAPRGRHSPQQGGKQYCAHMFMRMDVCMSVHR